LTLAVLAGGLITIVNEEFLPGQPLWVHTVVAAGIALAFVLGYVLWVKRRSG